jgi:microcystin-dependent protein
MSDWFLGEIRLMSFNYPPHNWALCNGQQLPINQNQPLFALLGTTYGGNGQTTFALPDLRDRVPIHAGNGHGLGDRGGEPSHTLSIGEMPAHNHALVASGASATTAAVASDAVLGARHNQYGGPAAVTTAHPSAVTVTGGGQAHENRMPFLTVMFCIALTGIFPSRS